jgi:hypothetical protein
MSNSVIEELEAELEGFSQLKELEARRRVLQAELAILNGAIASLQQGQTRVLQRLLEERYAELYPEEARR